MSFVKKAKMKAKNRIKIMVTVINMLLVSISRGCNSYRSKTEHNTSLTIEQVSVPHHNRLFL